MINNYILIFVWILMWSVWAICLKIWSSSINNLELNLNNILLNIILNKYIIIWLFLYFIPATIWIYLLSKMPISFLQPILSLTYVITPLFALLFLKEPVPTLRWIGIFIIILGVFIVSKS